MDYRPKNILTIHGICMKNRIYQYFAPIIFFSIIFGISSFTFGSELLDRMTLEERVGQLLMVHFTGERANEEAKILVQEVKVGGIIYYNWSNGLNSPEQVKELSEGLQQLASSTRLKLPLLIAADQEGGRVMRLREGFTCPPSNRILGDTCDLSKVEAAAYTLGMELMEVGVNMDLAPVVDINTNPENPIIGDRSYGETSKVVVECGQAALSGFQRSGIISTIKHYPGHGDVEVDSHCAVPIINKSLLEMEEMELVPFAALASRADAIMTGHLLVPAFDKDNVSTLSKTTLDYLRNTIGFTGVIITDSLVMKGVLKNQESIEETAIKALNAGCDILLLAGRLLDGTAEGAELTAQDIKRIHHSIVEAVKGGKVSESRLNSAVERTLTLKKGISIHSRGT